MHGYFQKSHRRIVAIGMIIIPVFVHADETFLGDTDLSIEELFNVKITVASKNEEKISDAPGVISVITQDELRRFGGTTLGDILKRVPSLLGTTVYMTDRSILASRGDQVMPSSSHILLLINGRPIREILEGGIKSEVYESFPVDIIEHIEVIRGPGSVLYGSQAFSAIINVVTQRPDKNMTTISGNISDVWAGNVSANTRYMLGDAGIVLAGSYTDNRKWRTTWEAPGLNPDFIHKIDLALPDEGAGAYAELSYKDFRLMSSYTQWDNQFYVPDFQMLKDLGIIEVNATGTIQWKKLFADAGYHHEFSKRYRAGINATYTRSWLETKAWPFTYRDAYEAIVEQTNLITPFDNLHIVFGAVYGFMTGRERDPTIDSLVYNEGHDQGTFSGYMQVDYRMKWIKVLGGLQTNKVADFRVDYNPRYGLLLYPLEHIDIKMLYSTAYRAPSINELYLDFDHMRGQMVDRIPGDSYQDKNLEPEKVHTLDIGVNYHDEAVSVGINAFNSVMKNLIIQDRDTTHYALPTWDNIGEVSIFGLECEGKYYLARELLFVGSFLYQQSYDEITKETNVTPLPNFSVKGGLSYRSDCGLTVSTFTTFQEALDSRFSSRLNRTTGHFFMTDVYMKYDFNPYLKASFIKETAFLITIENLFNQEIWLPAWGLINGSTIPYNEGRTVYAGLRISL